MEKLNHKTIYIVMGNKVLLEAVELGSFKKFNEAWDFAKSLSKKLMEIKGLECSILTQGGTWILDSEE